MTLRLMAAALFFTLAGQAQTEAGMHFEHGKSWADIKAQAKKENKYIFLDAYTTWCGPCKYMSKNIFPLAEVGAFYNPNFVIAKFQIDTAANDDDAAKAQYADAAFIADEFKVRAYPTYLFLNPDGQLVHRELGSSDAAEFIEKGRNALDPEKQYYTQLRQYEAGNKAPDFLKKLAYGAKAAYEMEAAGNFAAQYLGTQTDLFTKDNVGFISEFTKSTNDPGFQLMLANTAKFDVVMGKGGAADAIRSILLDDYIYPRVFRRNSPTPDWKTIGSDLQKKYGVFGQDAAKKGELLYFQQKGEWKNFSMAVEAYLSKNKSGFTNAELNNFAWSIFENCDDAACLAQAVNWIKGATDLTKNAMYMDTYANLLHKNKRTKEAMAWQIKAIELAKAGGEDLTDYTSNLDKMKKGIPTW